MKKLLGWIRFGSVRSEIKSMDGGAISEIAFYGRGNKMIGYWAYGYYDPSFPLSGWWVK